MFIKRYATGFWFTVPANTSIAAIQKRVREVGGVLVLEQTPQFAQDAGVACFSAWFAGTDHTAEEIGYLLRPINALVVGDNLFLVAEKAVQAQEVNR